MTMLCPRCQVAYQDGQVCPSCGGYLVPYQPQMQPPAPQPAYDYAPEPSHEAAEAPVAPVSSSKGDGSHSGAFGARSPSDGLVRRPPDAPGP